MKSASRRVGLTLVCAALSCGLVSTAVRHAVPWSAEMQIGPRFEYLAAHPDSFDAIYFGSSHVYRSFVPSEIDAELARRGHRIRSFNFGTPGMSVFEMDFLIREVLALDSAKLRWVVFEYGFNRFESPDRILNIHNYYSDRAIFWHTPARTWDVVRTVLRSELAIDHRLNLVGAHLLHALWRWVGVGQAERIAAAHFGDHRQPTARFAETRGYEPLEGGRGISTQRDRAAFVENPRRYLEHIQTIDRENRRRVSTADFDLEPLLDLEAAIRGAGAHPVLVVTAFPYSTPALLTLEKRSEIAPLIALNSPARHPELYRPDHRFDGLHLNATGAREFSRHFAADFAALLDGETVR